MHMAAAEGKTDVVLLFLSKGVDINVGDEKTQGPIFYAAAGGHTELVKLLLDRKAALTPPGLLGEAAGTPLHDAARGGHVATMELLLARGVPLNAREFGETAFQVAAGAGQVESLRFLLSKGAKVDYTPPQYGNETALHLATQEGHLAAVKFLIESGANVNAVDAHFGRTPLHKICDHAGLDGERKEIAELLLDKGAKVDVKDSTGKTPLALALESRNDDAVKLLRERGAKE